MQETKAGQGYKESQRWLDAVLNCIVREAFTDKGIF